MSTIQGHKPKRCVCRRTASFKFLENDAAAPGSPQRLSSPLSYNLPVLEKQQSGIVSAVQPNADRSSRLLPLRQVIMARGATDQQQDDNNEFDDVVGGTLPDNASCVGSSIVVRSFFNGPEECARVEEAASPIPTHVDGAVAMELSGHPPRTTLRASPGSQKTEKQSVGFWKDFWQQFKQQQKVYTHLAMRKWWIVAVPLLLCLLLVALGVFGVVYAADRHEAQLRDYVRGALASTAISTVAGQLEIATFAVMTLSAYLTQQPNCTELNENYNKLADTIFQWDAKQAVYQLQAMPAAVVKYIHPYPDEALASQLIGRDILKLSQYRNDTLQQIRARGERLLLGPYNLLEGFKAMFVTFAVFLPAPDPSYDWDCGVQPYECPPDTCWVHDEDTGQYLKLWGMATSLVRLDALKEGFGFQQYDAQGYHYRLWQLPDDINQAALIDGSGRIPKKPVTLSLRKYNLQWVFEVAPAAGWVPGWRNPCIAAVVVGSVLVSTLVLWLLFTREKHKLLLRAMLPPKVIRQLQRGEQTVVEEYHDPVTILFTDIVSYTEVASQLTPLQVVRLLNDLYTEFDALTDKHGVYKVETIGDAFMCVSGCPRREDPVQAAVRMAGMAQDMVRMVDGFVAKVGGEEMKVKIRIGLHSGPVVAGVIGQRMPRYCLFGDTVNTASRMESNSSPMCINVSCMTAELLMRAGAVVVPYIAGPATPPAELLSSVKALRPSSQSLQQPQHHLQPQAPELLRVVSSPVRQEASPASCVLELPLAHSPLPSKRPPPQQQQSQAPSPRPQQQQQPLHTICCSTGADAGEPVWTNGHANGHGSPAAAGAAAASTAVPAAAAPLLLYSRGIIVVKGKGPMSCYWLGWQPGHFD